VILTDRLTAAYLVFTLAVVLARAEHVPQAPALFALNGGLLALLVVLSRARGRGGWIGEAAEWYPLAFFVIFFEEIGALVHAFSRQWYDPLLIAADRALFGVDPTVWLERYASYWLTEAMQLAYTSYFPLTLGVAIFLRRRHGLPGLRLLMLASAMTYYACYLVFIFFPIESPHHALRHLQQVELRGGAFMALIEWIERYGRVHGGAFPSAHVAGSVVALMTAWRFAPRLGMSLAPLVALLMASTVYGRYHYAVDVLAGILFGVCGYAVASRLQSRSPSVSGL
jgi:membrane-associated phospholipid phosphatase